MTPSKTITTAERLEKTISIDCCFFSKLVWWVFQSLKGLWYYTIVPLRRTSWRNDVSAAYCKFLLEVVILPVLPKNRKVTKEGSHQRLLVAKVVLWCQRALRLRWACETAWTVFFFFFLPQLGTARPFTEVKRRSHKIDNSIFYHKNKNKE